MSDFLQYVVKLPGKIISFKHSRQSRSWGYTACPREHTAFHFDHRNYVPLGRIIILMVNHSGILPLLYALGRKVGAIFFTGTSHLCDHMWAQFQLISTWLMGFFPDPPVFLPLQNRLPVKKTESPKIIRWVRNHFRRLVYWRIMPKAERLSENEQ